MAKRIDPDDAPEWPDGAWDRARISISGKIIREATGTLTKTSDELRGAIVGAPADPEAFG